jgi:hypothetical protein
MGPLKNFNHERFCQAAHRRVWSGEKQVLACHAAYRETIYEGNNPDENAIAANVRRLRNRPDIKTRMRELADHSAKMAGLDAGWALVRTRQIVDFDVGVFLKGNGNLSDFPGDVEIIEEEASNDSNLPRRKLFKLKAKAADRIAGLNLMAKIAGWLAPDKLEATTEAKQIIYEVVTNVPDPEVNWRQDDNRASPAIESS